MTCKYLASMTYGDGNDQTVLKDQTLNDIQSNTDLSKTK